MSFAITSIVFSKVLEGSVLRFLYLPTEINLENTDLGRLEQSKNC